MLDPAAEGLTHGPNDDKDSWREREGDREADFDADRLPSKTAAPLRAAVLGEGSEALEDRSVVAIVGGEEMALATERPSRSREEEEEEEEEHGSSADLLLRGGEDEEDDADDTEEEESVG